MQDRARVTDPETQCDAGSEGWAGVQLGPGSFWDSGSGGLFMTRIQPGDSHPAPISTEQTCLRRGGMDGGGRKEGKENTERHSR